MTEPGAYGGPTALRIMLGVHLRRLREDAGDQPVRRGLGDPWLGVQDQPARARPGRFKVRDVDDLLTLYKLEDGEERERCSTWPARRTTRAGGNGTTT